MAIVWLVGFEDASLTEGLQAAGHTVATMELARLLAEDAPSSADVGLVRAGPQPATVARNLRLQAPTVSWVILLPQGAAELAAPVLEAGASDVRVEPLAPEAARVLVTRLQRDQRTRARLEYLDEREGRDAQFQKLIGESPAMRELLDQVTRVARRSALGPPLSTLITGETGTGKGLLARVLHFSGRRRQGPFIELNCGAVPATLIESELFGHERGAFTDAKTSRVGLIEAAHTGSLFLDEISCMPLEGQAKLLTVLETRRVRRLGGTTERPVDLQIIAASSHDIPSLVSQGSFRPELLHRLAGLWFKLPPLRERGGDAILLAERFLERVTQTYRLPPKRLSSAARAAIASHPWPGNVRELYHAIERAVLLEDRIEVEVSDLALQPGAPWSITPEASGAVHVTLPQGGVALADIERAAIECALRMEGGNVTRAAAFLQITRDTLRSRMEKLGLEAKSFAVR